MKKNIFLSISLIGITMYCSDKPIRGGSAGTTVPRAPRGSISMAGVPYERPDQSKHGGIDASDKPIRGGSAGTSVPYQPTQRSWFRSFFRPDQRTVRKVTRRPESTTIEYVNDDKTLENISPYGTEMTYDPGTLRPQKEVINEQNQMPAVRAEEPGYVSKTTYYPETGKKSTYYGGQRTTRTPTGFIMHGTKVTELPNGRNVAEFSAKKAQPVNTNQGFWASKWSGFMNWWNSR